MIRHIVLFSLKKDIEESEKASQLKGFKEEFEGLVGQIPSLRSLEIGLNVNSKESYDMALVATADDMEGLQAYAVDPRHQAIVAKLKPMLESRACTDYKY